MSARQQNEIVANWILGNCSEEIGDEGAGDVAVRLLTKYHGALTRIVLELKPEVILENCPVMVCVAYQHAQDALIPNPLISPFNNIVMELDKDDQS